jgi:hypothetical protein
MNRNEKIKWIVILATFLMAVLILIYGLQRNRLSIESTGTSATDRSEVDTSKITPVPTMTPTPTPTKKPTSKPTPKATPTPTPTPVTSAQSVYISREVNTDGRILPEGYYAVLRGEGGYYNIFDCFGSYEGAFFHVSGYGNSPSPIMTERELCLFYRPNEDLITDMNIDSMEYEYSNLISTENGFYQVGYSETETIIILYNPAGEIIQTLAYSYKLEDGEEWANADVMCVDEEFVAWFTTEDREIIYFVAPDGTINDQYNFAGRYSDSTYQCLPDQLLGRKYYIRENNVYDLSGKIVMKDVDVMEYFSEIAYGWNWYMYLTLSDYFIKDGKTYDLSLHPVAKNTRDADGGLIFGVEYDVDGILCQAIYDKKEGSNFYSGEELVAVGYDTNQMAVLTKDNSYTFQLESGYKFLGMNHQVILLQNVGNGIVQMISLKTQEIICTINNSTDDKIQGITIANEYVIVEKSWRESGNGNVWGEYIIDKEGNVRYFIENAEVRETVGEFILLERGPYYGIADLNGEWVLKSLVWELNSDAEHVYSDYEGV